MKHLLLLCILLGCTSYVSGQSYDWIHQLASPGMDFSNNILIDDDGNVYSTGFYRTGEFEVSGEILPFVDNMDSYLARYRADGQLDWVVPFYGKGVFDRTEALALNADDLYVLSVIQEEFNIGDQETVTIDSLRNNDILLMKFTTAGELQWSRTFGGPSSDLAYYMHLRENDILLTGHFYDTLYFGDETLVAQNASQDMFLASVTLDGDPLWIRQYGGPDPDRLYHIAEHVNGDLAICGYTDGTWTFGATELQETGARDMFVGRTDANGNPLWAIQLDSGDDINAEGFVVACDDAGNTYLASSFRDNIAVDNITIEDAGGYQMLLARFDENGQLDWMSTSNSQGNDGGSGFYDLIYREGRLIASGALASGNELFGQVYDDIPNLDMCIAILDTDGNAEFVFHDGGTGVQTAFGIDMNASHSLACAVWGDKGVQIGGTDYIGAGYDIFLVKMDFSNIISSSRTVRSDASLRVYPNPVNDKLNVSWTDAQNLSLRIIDMQGHVCLDVRGTTVLDVSGLPSGNYLLYASDGEHLWIRKVEIVH